MPESVGTRPSCSGDLPYCTNPSRQPPHAQHLGRCPTGGKRPHLELHGGQPLGDEFSMSIGAFRISALSVMDVKLDENSLDGRHLVVTCSISFGDSVIQTYALIDCGATGFCFVDESFVRHHSLPRIPLNKPRSLEVIDGRPIASGDITHLSKVGMTIADHHEQLPMFITKLGHCPIVLGIP